VGDNLRVFICDTPVQAIAEGFLSHLKSLFVELFDFCKEGIEVLVHLLVVKNSLAV
jgi:hypothetical protein